MLAAWEAQRLADLEAFREKTQRAYLVTGMKLCWRAEGMCSISAQLFWQACMQSCTRYQRRANSGRACLI